MILGGLQKLTLLDYPGKVACTAFTSGCNFRCPFCYSPELVLPEKIKNHPQISQEYFFDFLKKRKEFLDGVVVCGGEPTIQKDLPDFLKKIKSLGYLIKIDTNGSDPQVLKELVSQGLIDYIAMDIKGPKEKYEMCAGTKVDLEKIQESIDFLKEGKVDYEFRTTVVPSLHQREDIIKIAYWLKGAKKYYLQNFLPQKTLDPSFEKIRPYSKEFLLKIRKEISSFFEDCQIR